MTCLERPEDHDLAAETEQLLIGEEAAALTHPASLLLRRVVLCDVLQHGG